MPTADGQLASLSRYAGLTAEASLAVNHTDYRYDAVGRLKKISHHDGAGPSGTLVAGYGYAYDNSHRLTAVDFLPALYNAEDVTYGYDLRGQVTSANYAGAALIDEAYAYDDNGNRVGAQTTGAGASTYAPTAGTNNRLTDDGVYTYEYDAEGNRTFRTHKTTGATTRYTWDHRNRLVKVAEYATVFKAITQSDPTKVVEHRYDAFNQWVGQTVDPDGAGPLAATQTVFVYDDGQVVLQFEGPAGEPLTRGDLTHRYLWGPAVDQVLADEQVDWATDGDADGPILWALADHLGTVRDLADSTGAVVNHRVYDAFGALVSETNAAKDFLFGYTGKALDDATGLQNNLNRWYDSRVGRWISEDPIGFEAGDANRGVCRAES